MNEKFSSSHLLGLTDDELTRLADRGEVSIGQLLEVRLEKATRVQRDVALQEMANGQFDESQLAREGLTDRILRQAQRHLE
jgi:hypothetical protein